MSPRVEIPVLSNLARQEELFSSTGRAFSKLRPRGGMLRVAVLFSLVGVACTTTEVLLVVPAKPNLTGTVSLGASFVNPALELATTDELIVVVAPVNRGRVDLSKASAKMLAVAKTAGSYSASSAPYGFESLPSTPFVLLAVKDVNANKKIDAGDYLGWYSSSGSGANASVTTITPPLTNADFDVDKLTSGPESAFVGAGSDVNAEDLRGLIAGVVANPPLKPALPITPLGVFRP